MENSPLLPPLMSVIVEPVPPTDNTKLIAALEQHAATDPGLSWTMEADTGQLTLHGQQELQLEILIDSLKRDFSLTLQVWAPQIAYRETITRRVDITYRHKQGTAPAFAELSLSFEPGEQHTGALFKDATAAGTLPPNYVTAIAEGLAGAKESGHFAGFPYVDFMATLTGADYSPDASAELFTMAARVTFGQAMCRAQPVLLEPIMKVDVMTPEDFLGDVIGDLNSRRGQISSMEQHNHNRLVQATVPLAIMFGYHNKLYSMTKRRAECLMEYSHYDTVPTNKTPAPPNDRFPSAAALRQAPYSVTNLDGSSR